ncbi:MAG: O-methyltransferase [Nitrososphaerales archaeon]
MSNGIIVPRVDEYLHSLLRPRDAVLRSLEKDAEKNGVPIIGPLVGNLLSLLVKISYAKNALEIGTATGYSGLWLARALAENSGKLTTIEMDPKRIKRAEESFREAGLDSYVKILKGDARIILPELAKKQEYDLILLDVGDKSFYIDAIEPCFAMLKVGGLFISDNVLWSGCVAVPSDRSKETETMRRFNKMVYSNKRFEPVIVPLRDGLLVARKTSS